jgi:hypothetical protein
MIKSLIFATTFFLCLGGLSNNLNAQSEKTIVGILPFTYTDGAANPQDVNSIQEAVANAFVTAKRFNIVDRTKMDALKNEKELQKTEDFLDGTVISQSASLGAQFLISGHVVSATTDEFTVQDPNTGQISSSGFKAKLSISLKVIDVATGQVTTAETIEPKGGSMLGQLAGVAPTSPEAAITKAIKDIESKIDEFVSRNFPVTFQIAEIQEKDNSGSAKTLLLAGGSEFGLKKGDKLKVVELLEMEVGGKKMLRKKEIGELQITKVEDEYFSICSVKSGGSDINSKFDAKGNLQVISL